MDDDYAFSRAVLPEAQPPDGAPSHSDPEWLLTRRELAETFRLELDTFRKEFLQDLRAELLPWCSKDSRQPETRQPGSVLLNCNVVNQLNQGSVKHIGNDSERVVDIGNASDGQIVADIEQHCFSNHDDSHAGSSSSSVCAMDEEVVQAEIDQFGEDLVKTTAPSFILRRSSDALAKVSAEMSAEDSAGIIATPRRISRPSVPPSELEFLPDSSSAIATSRRGSQLSQVSLASRAFDFVDDANQNYSSLLRMPALRRNSQDVGRPQGWASKTASSAVNAFQRRRHSISSAGSINTASSRGTNLGSCSSFDLGVHGPFHDDEPNSIRTGCQAALDHPYFEVCILILIILNGVAIGVQTEVSARRVLSEEPVPFRILELFFAVTFALEIGIRLWVMRLKFFFGPDVGWNIFDLLLVVLQLLTEMLEIIFHTGQTNISFMRVVRIFRLVRIVRLLRIVRYINELRMIITSVVCTMRHLFWTLVILFIMIFIIAIALTQLVLDCRLRNRDTGTDISDLLNLWDTLGRSGLTLFEAILGGIDWDIALMPLIHHIGIFMAPVFCFFIAFSLLALMNVVTGVFVENAIDSVNRDKEKHLVETARELFEQADPDGTGVLTWEQFGRHLQHPTMRGYFKGLGVNSGSARALFKMLDHDNRGSINAAEFLTGTLRLRGDAKAIDIAALLAENRRMVRSLQKQSHSVFRSLKQIRTAVSPNAYAGRSSSFTEGGGRRLSSEAVVFGNPNAVTCEAPPAF